MCQEPRLADASLHPPLLLDCNRPKTRGRRIDRDRAIFIGPALITAAYEGADSCRRDNRTPQACQYVDRTWVLRASPSPRTEFLFSSLAVDPFARQTVAHRSAAGMTSPDHRRLFPLMDSPSLGSSDRTTPHRLRYLPCQARQLEERRAASDDDESADRPGAHSQHHFSKTCIWNLHLSSGCATHLLAFGCDG